MFQLLRFTVHSFRVHPHSLTVNRYLRNASKRVSVMKTVKDFKVKHIYEEEDMFDADDMSRRIKQNDLEIEKAFLEDDCLGSLAANDFEFNTWKEKGQKSMIKKKIIGRKFFKDEKETNLLTHAAKEQIRYLHKLNPCEWTPETLANSFPSSVEGIKKLLKSNFTLKDTQRIKHHDEDVKRKWESLITGKPLESIYPRTLYLWQSGKLLKENYNGNSMLPQTCDLNPQKNTIVLEKRKIGEFSAIIKKYVEYKNRKETEPNNTSEITVSTSNKNKWKNLTDDAKLDLEAKKFVKTSTVFNDEGTIVSKKKKILADAAELSFSQFKENLKHELNSDSKKSPAAKQYHQWIENDSDGKELKNSSSSFDTKEFTPRTPKYSKENVELKKGRLKDNESFYLYDENKGYQYPVGKTIKGKVKIPASLKRKQNSTYRVDQCVYDENGELLYKLPG